MSVFEKLRLYHAALALLALVAYATGEAGLIHAWLGYGVAVLLVFRITWAFFGPRQLGLARFLPRSSEIKTSNFPDHPAIGQLFIIAILTSVLVAVGTGVALDRLNSLPVLIWTADRAVTTPATVDRTKHAIATAGDREGDDDGKGESWLEEVHEASANLLLICVALHIAYLLLFKRKLAFFMLFRKSASRSAV